MSLASEYKIYALAKINWRDGTVSKYKGNDLKLYEYIGDINKKKIPTCSTLSEAKAQLNLLIDEFKSYGIEGIDFEIRSGNTIVHEGSIMFKY